MACLLRRHEPDPRNRAPLAQADGPDPDCLGHGRFLLPRAMGLLAQGRHSRRASSRRDRRREAVFPGGTPRRTRRRGPRALAGKRQHAGYGGGPLSAPPRGVEDSGLHRSSPPISMYLSSTNSSTPWREPPRPMPDSFTPPNGASSLEIAPLLMPTMPYSSASATRHTRPRSRA